MLNGADDCGLNCRCLAPPGVGAGVVIRMNVNRLQVIADQMWAYYPPSLTAATPNRLLPGGGTGVTLFGANFGDNLINAGSVSTVTIDSRPCAVPSPANWTDTSVYCVAPAGVSTDALVVVDAGGQTALARGLVHFLPPTVFEFAPRVVDTTGGAVMTVSGTNFSYGADMNVSVELRRAVPTQVRWPCGVLASNATAVTCVLPEGHGTGWHVVVINEDDAAGSAQASPNSPATLAYTPPNITSVEHVPGGSPALGDFTVRVNGTNLSRAPVVTVSGLPCPTVQLVQPHGSVTCTAPPWLVDSQAVVAVTVDGQTAAFSVPLQYDPPVLARVSPTLMDAVDPSLRLQLEIDGVNFGQPAVHGRAVVKNHTVYIGVAECGEPVWVSDSTLICSVGGVFAVGTYNVTLRIGEVVSRPTPGATLRFECGPGYFGTDGQYCAPCPDGAGCGGGVSPPIALVGYFPVAAGLFVACSPPDACLGGVNGTCSSLYFGPRCASCNVGAYRCVGLSLAGVVGLQLRFGEGVVVVVGFTGLTTQSIHWSAVGAFLLIPYDKWACA